jgi:hypothetical protein
MDPLFGHWTSDSRDFSYQRLGELRLAVAGRLFIAPSAAAPSAVSRLRLGT